MAYLELYLMIFMAIFPYAVVVSFVLMLTYLTIWSIVTKNSRIAASNSGEINEYD